MTVKPFFSAIWHFCTYLFWPRWGGRKSIRRCIGQSEEYISDLKSHCVESMFCREYSWKAKHPFKVMSFVNSMTWRMYDMSYAALTLLKQNRIVPSLCLVRACWENMVAIYELKVLVENCARQQKPQDDLDATLMRILFSNRYEKDNRFVGEEHFEQFKEYKAKNILTLLQRLEKDCPMIKDYYSAICEFVHPNHDGVYASYSYLNEANHTVYFGTQLNQESWLFEASLTILNCSIDLYISFIINIKENIGEFARICENSLKTTDEEGMI